MPRKNRAGGFLPISAILFFSAIAISGLAFSREDLFRHAKAQIPAPGSGEAVVLVPIVISEDTVWEKDDDTDFDRPILIDGEDGPAKLTIKAGTEVRLGGFVLEVRNGSVVALGTEEEPVIFSSKGEAPFSLLFSDYSEEAVSVLSHVRIVGGGVKPFSVPCEPLCFRPPFPTAYADDCVISSPSVSFESGDLRIDHTDFVGSLHTDIEANRYLGTPGSSLLVESSSLSDAASGIALFVDERCSESEEGPEECAYKKENDIRMRDNWYGSSEGPASDKHPNRNGARVVGSADIDGWLAKDPFPETSNVLFLPGIKASRLYMRTDSGSEDRLWLPNHFGDDLSDLSLNEDGESKNEVYTKDVIDEVGIPILGPNIYMSFLDDLEEAKNDGTMNDFVPFAYDWRRSVEVIAEGCTAYPDEECRSLADTALALATSSKSGKVTIVAHSNGGLLAKALLSRLEREERSDIVDRVVFVGTPQMGAPVSMLTLLYGYDEAIPTLVSESAARSLAERMPGAYGLLPSEEYFDRTNEALVSFLSTRTRFGSFRDAYGESIDDRDELVAFLSGAEDGREKPDPDEVSRENVLSSELLSDASNVSETLDDWTPPDGVAVVQIAGWGIDTVRGVEYAEKERSECSFFGVPIPFCSKTGAYDPIYEPVFTVDGDGVVPTPSALMLPTTSDVRRYWIDLNKILKNNHANLFEIDSLRDFLLLLFSGSEDDSKLPDFIDTERPSDYEGAARRIRMRLYSPLDITLTDESGNRTGPTTAETDDGTVVVVETGIPNSTYRIFDDRKYVSFPAGEDIDIRLDGYGEGSYTLALEEVSFGPLEESVVSSVTFSDLPVLSGTVVTLSVSKAGLVGLSTLQGDLNGDEPGGEYSVKPVLGGVATLSPASAETTEEDEKESDDDGKDDVRKENCTLAVTTETTAPMEYGDNPTASVSDSIPAPLPEAETSEVLGTEETGIRSISRNILGRIHGVLSFLLSDPFVSIELKSVLSYADRLISHVVGATGQRMIH
jgi:pimeloyl-ACP methyl ester carboxylesterase